MNTNLFAVQSTVWCVSVNREGRVVRGTPEDVMKSSWSRSPGAPEQLQRDQRHRGFSQDRMWFGLRRGSRADLPPWGEGFIFLLSLGFSFSLHLSLSSRFPLLWIACFVRYSFEVFNYRSLAFSSFLPFCFSVRSEFFPFLSFFISGLSTNRNSTILIFCSAIERWSPVPSDCMYISL